MGKPKLLSITIHPQKGGGHKVKHQFAPAASYSGPTREGGMSMNQPPPAEHSFGPGEQSSLMNHIAGALALKGIGGQKAGPSLTPQE